MDAMKSQKKSTEESLGFEKPREDTKNPAEEPLDANTEAQVPAFGPWKTPKGRFEPKENDIKVLPKATKLANQVL